MVKLYLALSRHLTTALLPHRINMELDLQSLFGLHVHSCTHWLRPRNPPLQHSGSYKRALLISQIDDISMWLPVLPHCLSKHFSLSPSGRRLAKEKRKTGERDKERQNANLRGFLCSPQNSQTSA
jgi:hypothetical protein